MTEYFALKAKQETGTDSTVEAALRRAWNACAGTACSKCGVSAWQYCRNWTRGAWQVTRFHRPRQDAAGARAILAEAGINGLNWAKAKGVFIWDDRTVPTVQVDP